MKFINWIKGVLSPESRGFWILLAVVMPGIPAIGLSVSAVLSQEFQCWLIGSGPNSETGSTTIRNLGLIIAGLVALPLAIWRGYLAHKQANTAQEQVEKSQQQVETAQQSLQNERYQKGAEMLDSKFLSVRLGGIYTLQRLAKEHPAEYHVPIMGLLCAFVRYPTEDKELEDRMKARAGVQEIRDDIEAIMQAIGKRTTEEVELEEKEGTFPDLRHADLRLALLRNLNLKNVQMSKANLSTVWFYESDLTNAFFYQADLTNAILADANLSGSHLSGAILASLFGAERHEFDVRGLTQEQLDEARADPENRPDVDGVIDAETGKPLKWNGGRGMPLKPREQRGEGGYV